jgi:sulfatase modifying factor 1
MKLVRQDGVRPAAPTIARTARSADSQHSSLTPFQMIPLASSNKPTASGPRVYGKNFTDLMWRIAQKARLLCWTCLHSVILACLATDASGAGELSSGSVFRDCPQCPEMIVLPPGDFVMGPIVGEEEDEGVPRDWRGVTPPRHWKKINSFIAVGKYPVTRGQYRAFASVTDIKDVGCVNSYGNTWIDESQWDWETTSFEQTDLHPVVCVSWHDAQSYVAWLRRITGEPYRLLTEIEWEYAARAGTSTRRYWGNDRSHEQQCGFANAADAAYGHYFVADKAANGSCSDGFVHTSPVGSFKPNSFGLYDMLGNVSEWVEDCFMNYNERLTTFGYAAVGTDCDMRVLRGGSWADPTWGVRASDRYRDLPDTRCMGIGFRVARTIVP